MAQPLKCNLCNNQATVHLTQILNNKVHKVDLCESCAQTKGVTDPAGFSLADLFVKEPVEEENGNQPVCGQCGYKQSDFRKRGRLGCPACYEVFAPLLDPVLTNMHKGTEHCGKVPAQALARKSIGEQIALAEEELKKAIASERYEDAADIRDRLLRLKADHLSETSSHVD